MESKKRIVQLMNQSGILIDQIYNFTNSNPESILPTFDKLLEYLSELKGFEDKGLFREDPSAAYSLDFFTKGRDTVLFSMATFKAQKAMECLKVGMPATEAFTILKELHTDLFNLSTKATDPKSIQRVMAAIDHSIKRIELEPDQILRDQLIKNLGSTLN